MDAVTSCSACCIALVFDTGQEIWTIISATFWRAGASQGISPQSFMVIRAVPPSISTATKAILAARFRRGPLVRAAGLFATLRTPGTINGGGVLARTGAALVFA